jgi:hypothetical protein
VAVIALGALVLAVSLGLAGSGATSPAAGQTNGPGEPTPQTDDSVPARDVTMIGASPGEAPEETWGIGRYGQESVLLRYTSEADWSLAPKQLLDAAGKPLTGFQLAHPEGGRYANPSPLAGQMTRDGSGVMLGTAPSSEKGVSTLHQVVLVREPGSAFQETAPVPKELLSDEEALFGVDQAPMVAALEEGGAGAHTGALVVPVGEKGVDAGVLHWDGSSWTREPIEIPAKSEQQFEVLAIGASSPGNAWLIARLSSEYPSGSVALFRRHLGKAGETPTWQPVAPKLGGEAGEPLTVPVLENGQAAAPKPFTLPSNDQAQVLTVTDEGVWIDGLRRDAQAPTTMFFKPEAAPSVRMVSWCEIPPGAPSGADECEHELPEALPTGPSRSFAWDNSERPSGEPEEQFGTRVITGLPDGVSLRLEGMEFRRVLALGGDSGASFGAAFTNAREGWLGKELLPVQLTTHPASSRLSPWPVPFRHALVALAPQPGAPVGSASSQVLGVGDQGEVARYEPGEGWLPETLFGPAGRHDATPLRAVAWPTPSRAYAVGTADKEGEPQMWLWRAETGLWEPDPATPQNFRGNLLGIAFEPGDPSRGYAVGQQGVLLRYGKTWTQEPTCEAGVPQPCLPPQVAGASFTSVAFAGSEAIVAYRKLPNPLLEVYEGGLLVNNGSGWHIDEGAATAMGVNVPWVVAGLTDGGAAFVAAGHDESAQVYERQSAGAAWEATPAHLPVGDEPGSLALFREGGALRAIVSGSQPDTYQVEDEQSPPPGTPPLFIPAYPLTTSPERGLLRQTASGWSDEEHELNDAKEPPGDYTHYDTPYQPDPVAAVLVNPTGSEGWAVGGYVDDENQRTKQLDTADVWRYPTEGQEPAGVGSSPLASEAGGSTFAIGGGAQCAAPCADRARTQIGPDVWLSHALSVAGQVSGLRAFLYTGPRVTSGETAGPATLVVPYKRELERYKEILAADPTAYAAASPTDLDGAHSEKTFESIFKPGFPKGFGEPECETEGCQSAFYTLEESNVNVIVLDSSTPVGQESQLTWLEQRLKESSASKKPAIVVGNADLSAQKEGGGATAQFANEVADILACGTAAGVCSEREHDERGVSAYFFDAPEQNVALPLHVGGATLETYGSGTLGYVSDTAEEKQDFIGASGFLLVHVGAPEAGTNLAKVNVELIPNIGELALEAVNGTLLRRSNAAVFDALARRPRAGNRAHNQSVEDETSPYIPIPSVCAGVECAKGLFPEYTISSSEPKVGGFVKPDLVADPTGHTVLLGANNEPIREPINPVTGREESKSGLFCAYNPGTTIVTISAGGLSYSLPVTVQAGSVRQPCGTVPAKKQALSQQQASPVPPPAPAPAPAGPAPASSPPLVPVPAPPAPTLAPPPAPVHPAAVPPPFIVQPVPPFLTPAFVPPPPPAPGEPTPPSGTSAVTSPVEAAQKEEEHEEAPESVSNQAVAYRAPEHEPAPEYLLGIVLLAAFAGAAGRRRPRSGRHELRVAPATLSASRGQRRMSRRSRLP